MEDCQLVRRLADLVRLRLDEQEARELADDIREIQDLVDRVKMVDPVKNGFTDSDTPRLSTPFRVDELSANRRVDLDRLTDKLENGFLVVPPVLGEDT